MKTRFWIKCCLFIVIICLGLARFHYVLNDGFTISNISSKSSDLLTLNIRDLSSSEMHDFNEAVHQDYTYLGKGCQSYVFVSQDGNYVIKFIKHQSFRSKPWVNAFSFIPSVEKFRVQKANEKRIKLETLLWSWKTAFENLPQETAIVYVHINHIPDLEKMITLYDKLGFKHKIDLGEMDFLIQKRATLLCPTIAQLMTSENDSKAKDLIDQLVSMLLDENQRGYIDNDHALMQNTGVLNGNPIHIDVGQLVFNEKIKDPSVHQQELYNKIYHFYKWLEVNYAELALHLEKRLTAAIGDFHQLEPHTYNANFPNQRINNNSGISSRM